MFPVLLSCDRQCELAKERQMRIMSIEVWNIMERIYFSLKKKMLFTTESQILDQMSKPKYILLPLRGRSIILCPLILHNFQKASRFL